MGVYKIVFVTSVAWLFLNQSGAAATAETQKKGGLEASLLKAEEFILRKTKRAREATARVVIKVEDKITTGAQKASDKTQEFFNKNSKKPAKKQ